MLSNKSTFFPFGMLSKSYESGYRYGFNGQEKDDEVKSSTGASYDFGSRIYDPRLGSWFSTDQYENIFPGLSPYSFALNNPIRFVDVEGMWPGDANLMIMIGDWGAGAVLKHGDWTVVYASSFEQAVVLMAKKGLKKKTFNNLLIGTHGLGDPKKNEGKFVSELKTVKGKNVQKGINNDAIAKAEDKQLTALANVLKYMDSNPTIVLGACHVAVSEEFNKLFYEFVSENVTGKFKVFASTTDLNYKAMGEEENYGRYKHLTPKFNKNVLEQEGGGIVQITDKGSSSYVYQSFSYSILNPTFGSIFDFSNKTTNTRRRKSTPSGKRRRSKGGNF